jgi:hypothetical protein
MSNQPKGSPGPDGVEAPPNRSTQDDREKTAVLTPAPASTDHPGGSPTSDAPALIDVSSRADNLITPHDAATVVDSNISSSVEAGTEEIFDVYFLSYLRWIIAVPVLIKAFLGSI